MKDHEGDGLVLSGEGHRRNRTPQTGRSGLDRKRLRAHPVQRPFPPQGSTKLVGMTCQRTAVFKLEVQRCRRWDPGSPLRSLCMDRRHRPDRGGNPACRSSCRPWYRNPSSRAGPDPAPTSSSGQRAAAGFTAPAVASLAERSSRVLGHSRKPTVPLQRGAPRRPLR